MIHRIPLTRTIQHPVNGTQEDLGLCFVTRFEVEGKVIFSASPRNMTTQERLAFDQATLTTHGYKWDPRA